MAKKLSRREIAEYCADHLLQGEDYVLDQVAAYLLDAKRTRELELVARDIEDALLSRGVAVADVASARSLSAESRATLTEFVTKTTGARRVALRETVEPSLLGGMKLSLPGQELDGTLRHRLMQLKANNA